MKEENQKEKFRGFVRRRRSFFLLTFMVVFLAAVTVAYVLPPIFKSQSTILVEEQKIPRDYVKSAITSFAEERLEGISQQVLSRSNLKVLVERFGLYPELRKSRPIKEVTMKMRENIILETINTKIIDKRTGKFKSVTIAFTLSYQGQDPGKVQVVTRELSSLFVQAESQEREKHAYDTTAFIQKELDDIKKQIQIQENIISKFKARHMDELPENTASNLNAIRRLERDIDAKNSRILSLQETKILLEGQLANVEPLSPIVIEGEKVAMNPSERLKLLYLQLSSLQATLSEKHPDVKKLKREISELEEQIGKSDASVAKVKKLNELQGQLAELNGRLGPKHPDVIKLSNEVSILSKEVSKMMVEKATVTLAKENPDNPAYITLKSRIIAVSTELKNLEQEKHRLNQQIEKYQKKVEKAPLLEREYNELIRNYEGAKKKYNETYNNLLEVKSSQEMIEREQGERFAIIDHANLPEKPFKPNRLGIILFGFVFALAAGFGISAVSESMDNSIKSVKDIQNITGTPVLSVLSLIETKKEKWARRFKSSLWIFALVCCIGILLLLIDQYVIKLDQIWTIFFERLKTTV
jgi:uncharacterized protein involved in exopolysaccharide biosynthesis